MPQVRIAFGADHFGANHAVADIPHFNHRTAFKWRVEARPAATGIELGCGIEQRLVTAHTMVDAIGFGAVVLAGKRPFGAFEATNVVLLGVKHRSPLFEGFVQLFHGYTSATEKARSVSSPQIGWHV